MLESVLQVMALENPRPSAKFSPLLSITMLPPPAVMVDAVIVVPEMLDEVIDAPLMFPLKVAEPVEASSVMVRTPAA